MIVSLPAPSLPSLLQRGSTCLLAGLTFLPPSARRARRGEI